MSYKHIKVPKKGEKVIVSDGKVKVPSNPIIPFIEGDGIGTDITPAMIAVVGLEKFKLKQFNNLDYPAKPRWPLDEKAVFLKGAGVKL